jgi:hypothetical protein
MKYRREREEQSSADDATATIASLN